MTVTFRIQGLGSLSRNVPGAARGHVGHSAQRDLCLISRSPSLGLASHDYWPAREPGLAHPLWTKLGSQPSLLLQNRGVTHPQRECLSVRLPEIGVSSNYSCPQRTIHNHVRLSTFPAARRSWMNPVFRQLSAVCSFTNSIHCTYSQGPRRHDKSMDLPGVFGCNDFIARLLRFLDGDNRLVAPRVPLDLSPDRRCYSVRGNIGSHLQETAKLDTSMRLGVLLRLFLGLPAEQIFGGSHKLLVDHGSVTHFPAGVTYRSFVSTARCAA